LIIEATDSELIHVDKEVIQAIEVSGFKSMFLEGVRELTKERREEALSVLAKENNIVVERGTYNSPTVNFAPLNYGVVKYHT
jgi:hypothetical protein